MLSPTSGASPWVLCLPGCLASLSSTQKPLRRQHSFVSIPSCDICPVPLGAPVSCASGTLGHWEVAHREVLREVILHCPFPLLFFLLRGISLSPPPPPVVGLGSPMGLELTLSDVGRMLSAKNTYCLFQRVSCHREAAVQQGMVFATHWHLDGDVQLAVRVNSGDVSLQGRHAQEMGVSALCFLFPTDTYRK